ncbi:MAG: FtsX-like permease family protein [Bacteroidales bacterium]|nr:FtsX-like permease family protein [Bacteroidales bacterium]
MNFPFFIARRYLVSKKSHNTINIISGISVCGVALATMALICTLSVFNGFHDMVASFFTAFDPELKIVPAEGKFMQHNDPKLQELRKDTRIAVFTETLEDNALLSYEGRQAIVTLKGVEDNFVELTGIESALYGDGHFELASDPLYYGILGIQLCRSLGVGAHFVDPMQVFAPKKGERINMANPAASFNQEEFLSPGVVFSVKQVKYDANYALISLAQARRVFSAPGAMTALELRCKEGVSVHAIKRDIQKQLGDSYKVLDRYEQQADVFRIMEVEKLLSYVFLTFILMIACFNIIGCLSMLIIDKKDDVRTLRNMGATDEQVGQIFMFEGRLIAALGAVIGLVLGLLLCWCQIQFGWLKLGDTSGNFVIDSYPVSVHFMDVLLVFLTVVVVGYLAVWYPVKSLSKRLLA